MNNILGSSINMPCTLFETITLFDDFSADDMQYGDMEEQDFLSLGLSDISRSTSLQKLILTASLNTIFLGRILLMVLLVFQLLEQKYHKVNVLIFYLQK